MHLFCFFMCEHCCLVSQPNKPFVSITHANCSSQDWLVACQTNCYVSSVALITNDTTQDVALNLKALCDPVIQV